MNKTLDTTAHLRKLRMSPRKVRLIVDLVRGMNAKEAVLQLQFSKKHAARPVKKLIESAIANAKHNHNVLENTLVVKTAFVNEGQTLKRWMPRAMGRATPLRKRMSHVTIVLSGEVDEKAAKQENNEPKKQESKTEKVETKDSEKKETKKTTAKKTTKKVEKSKKPASAKSSGVVKESKKKA